MELSDIVNVDLLSHPYNWIIVILMLALSVFALCLLAQPLGQIGGIVNVI